MLPEDNNNDFHQRMGGILRTTAKCPDDPRVSKSCRKNNFSFAQLDLDWRNPKYWPSKLDEDNGYLFVFIDNSFLSRRV
jgi:hypothetical protein